MEQVLNTKNLDASLLRTLRTVFLRVLYFSPCSALQRPLRAGLLASKLPHAVEQLKAVQATSQDSH